ncbi:transporter substrate-binding domain-containing protein [Vibrio metschnikovii]|uniref:substrate-binding periplasmic protein n=1 Tax=Vibrio metschnikovii TaxID=28172 RepID=UPI0029F92DC9|nr:transporter substrate-binding domain-containing protein [Vibrio metschnikovii]EKO3635329.1 transporter substrate-binding domain-containing protein [Vibrio metschnikovii]EKO3652364.1 transporter substrate-binding domain-containing protein [Vibrio metschnikovii]EKO3685979.1 transporter substrate-binding domain-containing protein [Vibrio metschnikovii]EKO3689360.1 transporter substrate-binding domain-containing protein [Vibrio metschnikovii]
MKWWLLCGLLIISNGLAASPLRVCVGDVNVWPPFTYWQGVTAEEKGQSLTGSATTLVLQALRQQEVDYQLLFMPWARVQHELAQANGRCDLTWDASYRHDRAEYSYFSVTLYRIQLGYFTLADSNNLLSHHQDSGVLCGVHGFNYQDFGLPREPSLRVNTVQQALDMLQKQRCDWFVSEIEPIYGGIQLGLYQLERPITPHLLGRDKQFHVQIRRDYPNALLLLNNINQFLIDAQQSGHAQAVFDRFLLFNAAEHQDP